MSLVGKIESLAVLKSGKALAAAGFLPDGRFVHVDAE